jgi:hypothetical protein
MTLWSEIINSSKEDVKEKYYNVEIDCNDFYSANLENVKEVSFNYKSDGNKIDNSLLDAIASLRQVTNECEIFVELDPKEKKYNLYELLKSSILAEFNIYVRKPKEEEIDDFVRLSEELAVTHAMFKTFLRPLWPVTPIIRDMFRKEILKENAPERMVIGEQVVHVDMFNNIYGEVKNTEEYIKLADEKIRGVVYKEVGGESGFRKIAQQAVTMSQKG